MTAYYNEIDTCAAQWLRNLIAAGHIAPGDVDERSIEDVRPDDLRGYAQCHFFAGIGVWSRALRSAGWGDNRPVCTGSCPCQPFSAAGKGAGFADERHLWPAWQHLIAECRPAILFGEQVASSDSGPWLDLVQDDLEAIDYAFGAVPFPSASVGAPHIRDRLYWVADSNTGFSNGTYRAVRTRGITSFSSRASCGVDHSGQNDDTSQSNAASGAQPKANGSANIFSGSGISPSRLVDSELQQRSCGQSRFGNEHDSCGRIESAATPSRLCGDMRPGPTNGYWAAADWLGCRDGKWRPVEPGTFPLAHGASSRVGRLRAYGNAINAIQAQIFIEAVMVAP